MKWFSIKFTGAILISCLKGTTSLKRRLLKLLYGCQCTNAMKYQNMVAISKTRKNQKNNLSDKDERSQGINASRDIVDECNNGGTM